MRELHGWHGDHARHARDAHPPPDTATARAHDGPKHAAQDALKLRMLLDPEARKAARLAYQQKVETAEAEYAARHAKPRESDQRRTPEQLKPQEPRPEHAPAESKDAPASVIGKRVIPERREALRQPKPERSRLPSNEVTQFAVSVSALATSVADAFNVIPARADGIAAGTLAAVVAGVAWGNKRWKDKHSDRSQG